MPIPDTLARPATDLDGFIDSQPLGRFHARVVGWSFMVLLTDGFDLVVLGYALPGMVAAWGIDRASMAPALSASLFGMLVGTPVAGYLGDRLGRRPVILASLLLFGAATIVTVFATGTSELVALRLLTGLGLSGVLPNTTALVSEYVPRRVRGSLLVLLQSGVQGGTILAGLTAVMLVAGHGWPVLFQVGGAWPIALTAVLAFVLPESAKFLALRPSREHRLLRVLHQLDPSALPGPSPGPSLGLPARFASAGAALPPSLSPQRAFQFGMHWITPLLWAAVALSLFTNLLFLGWAPTVLQDLGIGAPAAAAATGLFGLGGLLGSFILVALFDRLGFLVLIALGCGGVVAMAALGQPAVAATMLPLVAFLAGVCISGPQSALNSALGMLYPTPIRGTCVGWGLAAGRIGSIAGPLAGGWLIGRNVGPQRFFEVVAMPVAAGLLVTCLLAALCRRQFGSWRLDERPPARGGAGGAPDGEVRP